MRVSFFYEEMKSAFQMAQDALVADVFLNL